MYAFRSVELLKIAVAIAVSVCTLVGVSLPAAPAGAEKAHAGPRLIQVSYEESRDGSSREYNLSAFVHHADSVTFAVRRHHERLTARGKYNNHVTDTDIHSEDASHPWEVDRGSEGRRVLKAIRTSLGHDGEATVRVHARGVGGTDRARVQVLVADCTQDPPFYPLSCEISV